MSLVLQSSCGGQITIQEPATASNFTQTLPAVNGTVLTTGNIPAGSVLQVFSTTKSDTFTTTNTSYTDVTGLSISITPTSATSRILVFGHIDTGSSADVLVALRLMRDSTAIGIADAAGSRISASFGRYLGTAAAGIATHVNIPFSFLDSPATTSATTYKIQISSNAGGTLTVNRSSQDGDNSSTYRATSTITVMEIAA
jgi:hypothetical protein